MERVNLYIASKDQLCDDIFVVPDTGDIYREVNEYQQRFNEYVRDNKLYIVIGGIMYNKAKLIFDSVNRDNLPNKRYKVIVTDKNITRPTIKNIISTDLRAVEPVISSNDDLVSILVDDVDTEINVDYLLEKLSNKEWKVSTSDE